MGKLGSALVCLVFALPFGGVGVFATWAIGSTLMEAHRAQDWVRVKATVDDASLRTSSASHGGTTYRAEGRYRYTFQGRQYEGTRLGIGALGGADNIGDWQEEVSANLQDARAAGQTLSVWVDPDNPSDAVFDREIRWGQILFLVPFSLAFGGVGVGALVAMVYVVRGSKFGEAKAGRVTPARTGNTGQAAPGFLWVFAFFWNAMSFPIAFLALPEIIENGEWVGLLVLLFPLIGVGLLWAAISATWNAWFARRRWDRTVARKADAASPRGTFAAQAARAMFDPQGHSASLRRAAPTAVAIPASIAEVEERGGTLTIRYSRRRNLGLGMALLVVGAILTVIGVAIALADGIGFAVVVLVILGMLLDVAAVSAFVGALLVTVNGRELAAVKSGLFGSKSWKMPRESIASLRPSLSHSINGEPYFALYAQPRSGERILVGDGLKGTELADALAQRIGGALGLDPSKVERADPRPDRSTAPTPA